MHAQAIKFEGQSDSGNQVLVSTAKWICFPYSPYTCSYATFSPISQENTEGTWGKLTTNPRNSWETSLVSWIMFISKMENLKQQWDVPSAMHTRVNEYVVGFHDRLTSHPNLQKTNGFISIVCFCFTMVVQVTQKWNTGFLLRTHFKVDGIEIRNASVKNYVQDMKCRLSALLLRLKTLAINHAVRCKLQW